MRKTKEQLDKLVKSVRKNTGYVCDSLFRCDGWERSMKQITDCQTFMAITRDVKYTGLPFKYCPWCGKEI